MEDFKTLTLVEARRKLLAGETTAVALAKIALEAIERENKNLNAFLGVYEDVFEEAKKADQILKELGDKSPILTGIPIALKDNILVDGKPVSAASKILEGYRATYTATAAQKLKDAGAVLVGRTNMDEFALGSSTENSAYGPTKNPYDFSRVPGGTSGGSAAAVAAGLVVAALGSDTGGSVRQPSALCGLVGLKPTYGAVSRYGLIAAGSSFDQIGPLTKTVQEAEMLFSVIRGQDAMDSTTISANTYPKKESKSKMKIGVPRAFVEKGVDEDLRKIFDQTLDRLKQEGHDIIDIELPHGPNALSVYYILIFAEESTNLARFDGVRYGLHKEGTKLLEDYLFSRGEGFGAETRRRIILGTYVLSSGYYDAYYGKATSVRRLIRTDFDTAFEQVDVIATPTTPTPAFKIGEKVNDPLAMYLEDIFTVTPNLTGMPAISVPMGTVSREGKDLPVGIQFTAPLGAENVLFAIGKKVTGEVE